MTAEKIKVLHIISNSYLGGAQSQVRDLCQNLDNHFVYVFKKTQVNIFNNINDKVFYFNSFKPYKFSFSILLELKNIIKKNNFEILHLHLAKPLLYAFFLKIFFIHRINIIYHEHGFLISTHNKGFKYLWYIFYLNFFGLVVDKFIAVSNYVRNAFIDKAKISKNRIILLSNFVNQNKYSKENITWDIKNERTNLGIQSNQFVIGFSGRIDPEKGWERMINSVLELLNDNDKIKLLIAGDGPERDKMLRLISSSGHSNNINYLGFVNNMAWFYSLLDCLVVPSSSESMGLVAVEAQSMGIPVIAANIPALKEIITDNVNGIFFNIDNSGDLKNKINFLNRNDKLRNNLSKNGLTNAQQFYLTKYTKRLNQYYYDLRNK
ncbi:glycosyltransferase family 4 protein [Patescibacteria group bacterium]